MYWAPRSDLPELPLIKASRLNECFHSGSHHVPREITQILRTRPEKTGIKWNRPAQ